MLDIEDIKAPTQVSDRMKFLPLAVSMFFALISFFILMNVISVSNSSKTEQLNKSLKDEFLNRDLKDRLLLVNKKPFQQVVNESDRSFRDIISIFLDSQKNISAELSETPSNYMVRVKLNNFFSPENNLDRQNARDFITALNKYLSMIKREHASEAKLVMFYDDVNANDMAEKITNLHDIITPDQPQNITFSLKPLSTGELAAKMNYIYIAFNRNEF